VDFVQQHETNLDSKHAGRQADRLGLEIIEWRRQRRFSSTPVGIWSIKAHAWHGYRDCLTSAKKPMLPFSATFLVT
jgi:hypothetical protein